MVPDEYAVDGDDQRVVEAMYFGMTARITGFCLMALTTPGHFECAAQHLMEHLDDVEEMFPDIEHDYRKMAVAMAVTTAQMLMAQRYGDIDPDDIPPTDAFAEDLGQMKGFALRMRDPFTLWAEAQAVQEEAEAILREQE